MSARDLATIGEKATILNDFTLCQCTACQSGAKALDTFSYPGSYFADNPAGSATVTVGVPTTVLLTDTINPAGDFDVFQLNVVAGQTYMISVRGTGSNPLADSIVALFDSGFTLVDLDDDGGSGTNSLLTFTANYTGAYFIDVEAYPGSGLTGEYTLDVFVQGADSVPDTFAGAVDLTVGGVTFGFIESAATGPYGPGTGEVDTYKITVQAGKYYTIEVAGGADYASDYTALAPGELDTVALLYDSNGNLVTFNDDIAGADDISSKIGFLAAESGTYYLDVLSYAPWTGGYSITTEEIDLSTISPLDAIDWFSADNIDVNPDNVVKVYFAAAGESFGELADNGTDPLPSFGWNAFEKQQVMLALQEYTKILGFTYVETTNVAEAEFRLITTTSEDYGAYFYPQDPAFGDAQGIGAFNVDSGGWAFDQQQSLVRGGFAFAVVLHEFGHAHGLAHPHDNGGGSDVMAGVSGPFDSYGVFDLNQGVYTVMSYNDAWPLHPDGPSPFTAAGIDNGWSGSLSAFDIAVLQRRYGIVNAWATGNSVYELDDAQAQGTFYETIWDTAGTDEIRYGGDRDAQIDLTAATLDYSPTGGGVLSFVDDIKGGYTIANGVVIENATGGGGDDVLIGNSAANVLKGNGGDDFMMGGLGADRMEGGAGFDTVSYANATAAVSASLAAQRGTGGQAAGDVYSSVEALEGGAFNDTLTGGNGADTIRGLAGNDTITGGNSDDSLDGGDGDDNVDGGNSNDTMLGGAGTDRLAGGNGNDVAEGGDGADNLDGGNGGDWLDGGAGADTLSGGNDNDRLIGGAGNDVMNGGNGRDIFVFDDGSGDDFINDFRRGQDKIDLSAIDANTGAAGQQGFSWIGAAAFSGTAGQLRAYTQSGQYFVAGDVNGDGVADFTIRTSELVSQADIIFV